MELVSLPFLIALSVLFVIYYAVPQKIRYIVLLIASYLFYITWDWRYAFVLLGITCIAYFTSRIAYSLRCIATIGILSIVAVLCVFKYFLHELPIGISFYSLVAIGYIFDVYRDHEVCEKNILKVALFISFFPCVLSGPIERSNNLLKQISENKEFSYRDVKRGILLAMWGFFLKILIANRLAIIVDAAFESYVDQTGFTMLLAIIFYGIQLLADFAGYSYIAIGVAKMLGYNVPENFRQPYFSKSVKEFWGRWHISLSTWLKDYIYIPLGGNRKGIIQKYINLIITFAVSGLWHGTGWQFLVWGILHGIYQIVASITLPIRARFINKKNINRDCFGVRLLQAIVVYFLVDIAWLFFRAPSLRDAVNIIGKIATDLRMDETLHNRLYLMGYTFDRFALLIFEMLIWLGMDGIHEKGISVIHWLDEQNKAFRWGIYVLGTLVITIGAIYNYGIDASSFIYTRF